MQIEKIIDILIIQKVLMNKFILMFHIRDFKKSLEHYKKMFFSKTKNNLFILLKSSIRKHNIEYQFRKCLVYLI